MFEETSSDAVKMTSGRGRKRKVPLVQESSEDQAKRAKLHQTFVGEYGPQLNYSYNLWKNNSQVLSRAPVDDDLTDNPMQWNIFNVCTYVAKITDDMEVVGKFQDQAIDGAAFIAMSQNDLLNLMCIKMGPAVKIYNRIMHLREEVLMKFMKL